MAVSNTNLQEEIQLELIQCTRQPGWLRLTRQACALRYLTAQKKHIKVSSDEFGLARQSGLAICRNCPEGKRYAERLRLKGSRDSEMEG